MKPIAKTDAMTQGIGVDEVGALWATEGSGVSDDAFKLTQICSYDMADMTFPAYITTDFGLYNEIIVYVSARTDVACNVKVTLMPSFEYLAYADAEATLEAKVNNVYENSMNVIYTVYTLIGNEIGTTAMNTALLRVQMAKHEARKSENVTRTNGRLYTVPKWNGAYRIKIEKTVEEAVLVGNVTLYGRRIG